MNKVKIVCSSVGALGGAVLMTGTAFALIPAATVGAAAFAVGTIGGKKIGSIVGNGLENNPKVISIANTIYHSEKLPLSEEVYIDMEE